SLEQTLHDSGPLDPYRAAHIGLRMLDALQAAHAAGILHRDVKPSNVLLAERDQIVLTDFGIATIEGDMSLTRSGGVVGSPAYLAPERLRGERATPASDLWSLGATLYVMTEGRPPFAGENSMAAMAAALTQPVPPPRNAGALSPVLMALLQKD